MVGIVFAMASISLLRRLHYEPVQVPCMTTDTLVVTLRLAMTRRIGSLRSTAMR